MSDLADQADAYLRAVAASGDAYRHGRGFGERLGQFLTSELEPLLEFCADRGADQREHVLLPVAALLRQAADRLERGPDDGRQ